MLRERFSRRASRSPRRTRRRAPTPQSSYQREPQVSGICADGSPRPQWIGRDVFVAAFPAPGGARRGRRHGLTLTRQVQSMAMTSIEPPRTPGHADRSSRGNRRAQHPDVRHYDEHGVLILLPASTPTRLPLPHGGPAVRGARICELGDGGCPSRRSQRWSGAPVTLRPRLYPRGPAHFVDDAATQS
jgi:hypothetical protein